MDEEYKKKIEKLKQELSIMKTLNIKPNYSELSKIYKLDRRTIKKYNNGYSKSEVKRNRKSKLDKYYDEIKERLGDLDKSSTALVEVVMNKEFENVTGKYFDRSTKYINSSELSYNEENRIDLWNKSIEWTNLKREETINGII